MSSIVKWVGRVKVLPIGSTLEEVKEYLKWLANSQFDYHIDDDPRDIIWNGVDRITQDEIDQLVRNSKRMWNYCSAEFLWDNYPFKIFEE
jgi:hypothetical protein